MSDGPGSAIPGPREAPTPPAPPPSPASEEGFLETAVSVITHPVPTLRRVTTEAPLAWAIVLVLVVWLAYGLITGAQMLSMPLGFDPELGALPPGFQRAMAVVVAVATPLVGLIGLAIGTAILHGLARLFKGTGSYRGLFCGLGFASVPYFLGIPAQLLPVVMGLAGEVLAALVSLGIGVWVLVLAAIAVRESHRLSTGKAVAVLLIPVATLILVVLGLVVLVAILIAASFA